MCAHMWFVGGCACVCNMHDLWGVCAYIVTLQITHARVCTFACVICGVDVDDGCVIRPVCTWVHMCTRVCVNCAGVGERLGPLPPLTSCCWI